MSRARSGYSWIPRPVRRPRSNERKWSKSGVGAAGSLAASSQRRTASACFAYRSVRELTHLIRAHRTTLAHERFHRHVRQLRPVDRGSPWVDAGELNSDRISTATAAGIYSFDQFPTLWQSAPIPQDPITVRGNLPTPYKQKIKQALLEFDFTSLPDDVQKMFKDDVAMAGTHLVPQTDDAFDEVRSLVDTMGLGLADL